jgi:hypothetical protein
MLPISAIVGVSSVGYLLDQIFKEKEFDKNNEDANIPNINSNLINGCADQYPWNFVESFDDINNKPQPKKSNIPDNILNTNIVNGINGMNELNELNEMAKINQSPLNTTNINYPKDIHAINNAGNPPPEYFINANERPIDDFVVNNMVPYFKGTSTNQDMRGTGVAQANVNSDDFNLGNGRLTAHYQTLADFTGCDNTYLHKREVCALFSPNEQRDKFTIPGEDASAQRPLMDRYSTSILHKNDQKPFESLQVGPGINVESDMPNDGQGYNSGLATRIKLNNVNEYRLTQLPGRIAGTKYQASNLPTALVGTGPSFNTRENSKIYPGNSNGNGNGNGNDNNQNNNENFNGTQMYGVPNKKLPLSTINTLERRPMTATPAVTQAPMHYSNFVFPSGTDKRTVTNVSFGQSIDIK